MASTPWGGGRERIGWDLPPKGLLRALCRPSLEALENYYAVCRQTLNIRGTCPESLSWCENQATDPYSDFKDSEVVEIPEFPREVNIAQATWQPGAEAEPTRVFSLLTSWGHASPTVDKLLSVAPRVKKSLVSGAPRGSKEFPHPTSLLIPNTTSLLKSKERGCRHAYSSAPLFIQPIHVKNFHM